MSIYKMIEDIITLTKESEYKSREIVVEKRKGDVLLYDVSIRLEILLISLKCSDSHKKPPPLYKDISTFCKKMQRLQSMAKLYGLLQCYSDRRILLRSVNQTWGLSYQILIFPQTM